MLKKLGLISFWFMAFSSSVLNAQTEKHPFETMRGLERFDKSQVLTHENLSKPEFSIKNVHIGDNVLNQAIQLAEQGGQLGRIHGGSRSDKVTLSFDQSYENTRLEQTIELHFGKHNGFIKQVTATYLLADAYQSIIPIREQTLAAAVAKFGEPLTMQQAYAFIGKQGGEIPLDDFITAIRSELHPLTLKYLKDRNISRSTKWVKGTQDYALLQSGFDRCYFWPTTGFEQLLTFCFFDETGANTNSRGVELNLHHFPIKQAIVELGNPHSKPDISL